MLVPGFFLECREHVLACPLFHDLWSVEPLFTSAKGAHMKGNESAAERACASASWRVVATVLVLVASASCKSAKHYPTISSRTPDGGNVNPQIAFNHCPESTFVASPDHVTIG